MTGRGSKFRFSGYCYKENEVYNSLVPNQGTVMFYGSILESSLNAEQHIILRSPGFVLQIESIFLFLKQTW